MHKPKSNLLSEHKGTSSLLLSHIKDEHFYSTLSTITLQLAKETGASQTIIDELSRCFSASRTASNVPMLTLQKQNNHSRQNNNLYPTGTYDQFQKGISLKEQVSFLSKMEKDLVQSREKQVCFNALKKYTKQKQAELMPLSNTTPLTKTDRFRKMLNRKQHGRVCTSADYFKMNPLELLKNAYENSNECYRMMRNFTLLKTVFGHSMDEDPQSNCPLYNVLFDQSENLIISGGEEGAIKIWSKQTGLLLSSLKGHQEYINKLEVTKCNKYICSSAGDGVRFFELKDMTTLTGWKAESIIEITSVYDEGKKLSKFIFGDKKNLYLLDELRMLAAKQRSMTKEDFSIYKYSHKLNKQSFILNIQVSSDHKYVLLGFEYGDIFLFHYNELFTIDPIKSQTEPLSNVYNLPIRHHLRNHCDEIRELKWHQNNQHFVSGGKEGYCLLWEYKNQKTPTLLKDIQVSKLFNRRKKRAFGCNFILFNCTYTHFIAGFMELVDQDDDDRGNGDVIAYSLETKDVIFEFSKDMPIKVASVRGMDAHPIYPNIVVVCEGTGRILVIDFLLKTILNTFELRGFHLLHPHFALNPGDCRFSKDGRYFVVSTEFGSISIFGYDLKNFYETCPSEQFYESDFMPFTVNQKMQPIPIEGELQIDMNRIERGQIRRIRGTPYEKQLSHNFHKYWEELQHQNRLKPIEHKNSLKIKDDHDEQNNTYREYLQKIKHNGVETQTFNKLYHKNLQQIQATKQSLLYDERDKQLKVFKKIIQQKIRKLKGDTLVPNQVNRVPLVELSHDQILQKIDAKGRRGGRKLTRQSQQPNPMYRDEVGDFDYDIAESQEFNINEEAPQDQELNQLDYSVDNSSQQIPRNTRRQFTSRRTRPESNPRYNIRSRPNGRTHYRQQDSEQQKKQRNFKRRTPAEDVQEMLKDQAFRNYDMSQGRKKTKHNKITQSDQDFIQDKSDESEFVESSHSHHIRTRQPHNNSRRSRPHRRMIIPELEESSQQQPQQQFSRLRKKPQIHESQSHDQKPSSQQIRHNLRTRNQNTTNSKNSSTKKPKTKDLGECHRCAVNMASVQCHYEECGSAQCDKCKFKRGKQLSDGRFECFVCSYINSMGAAVLDEKKLTEEYFRVNDREQNIFVPQIDDMVRFFFQGYEDFLAHNIRYLNIEPIDSVENYLLMPHIYPDFFGDVLLQTPLCRVKGIKYFFPLNPSSDYLSTIYKRRTSTNQKKHINMLINLEIIVQDEGKKKDLKREDFWVFYIPGPALIDSDNQYLVREQIYKYIEENKILQAVKEHQTVQIYGQDYQIIEVSPIQDSFPESIWRQIKVSRLDGKRLRNTSKQAERRCNIWQINSLIPVIQYKQDYKPQQYQKKVLDKINYIRNTIDGHELYQNYVEFQIVPTYRKMIQCGICISSIEQRLRNNFYRSLNSFIFDLDLLAKNTINFNGQQSQITSNGILIRKQLLKAINATDQIIKKFGTQKSQKQDIKQNKREKRIVKKKQMDSDFIVDDQIISSSINSLRNQRPTRTKTQPSIEKVQKRSAPSSKFQIPEESQSEFNQPIQESSQDHLARPKRQSSRPNRLTPAPHPKNEPGSTRSRRNDKITEDYDKEEEVYRNLQNSRRNRSRYIDSSYDSNEKNSWQAGNPTRKSSRLQH